MQTASTETTLDIRDRAFEAIETKLAGKRQRVYDALLLHGPCTTYQLSGKIPMNILTVRPRVTELVQLGLVELSGETRSHEGQYRAIPLPEARTRHELQRSDRRAGLDRQLNLRLDA